MAFGTVILLVLVIEVRASPDDLWMIDGSQNSDLVDSILAFALCHGFDVDFFQRILYPVGNAYAAVNAAKRSLPDQFQVLEIFESTSF